MNKSHRAYAEPMRHRAMSTLKFISESEFEEGMRALDEAARDERTPTPVFEDVDLLHFWAAAC